MFRQGGGGLPLGPHRPLPWTPSSPPPAQASPSPPPPPPEKKITAETPPPLQGLHGVTERGTGFDSRTGASQVMPSRCRGWRVLSDLAGLQRATTRAGGIRDVGTLEWRNLVQRKFGTGS